MTLPPAPIPPYAEYIRSQSWINRCVAFFGDEPVCGVRGCWRRWREGHVEVHHRTYERLGREAEGDLVPLCRGHHKRAHDVARALALAELGGVERSMPDGRSVIDFPGRTRAERAALLNEALRRGTDAVCPPEDVAQARRAYWRPRRD